MSPPPGRPKEGSVTRISTRCCIAGGGPAGMMLGYLLARSGVEVTVLEKHRDFLRDFRGDTIHPSTLTVMEDLGILDDFLRLPHQRVDRLGADVYGHAVTIADFTYLKAARPYLVLLPQWDFLNFIADQARRYPHFHLMMATKASRVIERDGRIVGLHAERSGNAAEAADGTRTASGSAYPGDAQLEIECDLVVAADGRHTTVRESAGLATEELGAPMDVLWFRLSRDPTRENAVTGGYIRPGLFLVAINRDTYWQCGYVIGKGSAEKLRAAGLDALKAKIVECAPFLQPSLAELHDWEDLKLLSVQVSRMPRWYREGLVCIGDAAHAMSPVGGVGINLAIQDAVAAANLLAEPLRAGRLVTADLAALQRRRDWPTRVTQRMQIAVQNEVLAPVLAGAQATEANHSAEAPDHDEAAIASQLPLPIPLRLLRRLPTLSRFPARLVGLGVRPERVRSREAPHS